MTISELARYLRQNGFYHEANRGLFRAISCAYDAFVEEGDQDTADCIANAYTTDNGEYAWGN